MLPRRTRVGFLLGFLGLPLLVGATTIRSVSLEGMLEHAEFVFEGTVSSTEVRAGEDPSSIRTCARFDIIEILNGPDIGATIELCFAGGTMGGIRRKIEGMVYPKRGETGIYFVKSLTERHVNPFYGWRQGHFRAVRPDDSVTHEVRVPDGRAVVSIDWTDWEPDEGLSTGVARGVRVTRPSATGPRPMTFEGFKAKLRDMLGKMQ